MAACRPFWNGLGLHLLLSRLLSNPMTFMKSHLSIAAFILCAALTSAPAQPGFTGAPHVPDFSGATGKLFDDYSSFSATLSIRISGAIPTTISGRFTASDCKTRFEADMTSFTGSGIDPQKTASMLAMGMGTLISISRPDRNVKYLTYPGLNAYVEKPLSDSSSNALASRFKSETTKLGAETIDGRACIKNKVVVTVDKKDQYEFTVWNATDLKNFPVKIEQNENGTVTVMTFKDIKFDKVPADKFEVPAGATKYDNMMTMMQQEMMKRAMQNHGNP
jgi:hypothetical protein